MTNPTTADRARREALARRQQIEQRIEAAKAELAAAREVERRKLVEDFPAPPLPASIVPGSRAADYWADWAAGKPTASAEHFADVEEACVLAGGGRRRRGVGGIEYASGLRGRFGPQMVAEAIQRMTESESPGSVA